MKRVLTWIVGASVCAFYVWFVRRLFSWDEGHFLPSGDFKIDKAGWLVDRQFLIPIGLVGCCGILMATYLFEKYSKKRPISN